MMKSSIFRIMLVAVLCVHFAKAECDGPTVDQCRSSVVVPETCAYEAVCDSIIEWTECHECDCSGQSIADVEEFATSFESRCTDSTEIVDWSFDALGEMCMPFFQCLNMQCVTPEFGCVMAAASKFMIEESACSNQTAVCTFAQEIADSYPGCADCESMVMEAVMSSTENMTSCDIDEVFIQANCMTCNRDAASGTTCASDECIDSFCLMADEMMYAMLGMTVGLGAGCPEQDVLCKMLSNSTQCVKDSCSCEDRIDAEFMDKRIDVLEGVGCTELNNAYLKENCFCGYIDPDVDSSARTKVVSFSYFTGTIFLANLLRVHVAL